MNGNYKISFASHHHITNYIYAIVSLSLRDAMKYFAFLLLAAVILLGGCLGEKTVKTGDNISVDYIGSLENGKIFDTSIESVAIESNLFTPGRKYKPFHFIVGKGETIKGFDEGVIGMRVGETKTLTIPPEKGYGLINTRMIQSSPIIEEVPTRFPRVVEIPAGEFESSFGSRKVGDTVTIPGTDINLTVDKIASNVSLSYNLKVGDRIPSGAPWNETVVKVDDKNITVEYSVKKNETVQLPDVPWNTTVIGVNSDKITMRHNPIPEKVIRTMFGQVKISFNETSIIMDRNHELAGKTLIFNITLRSIEKT